MRLKRNIPTVSLLNLLENVIGRSSSRKPLPYNGSIIEMASEADDFIGNITRTIETAEKQYKKLFNTTEEET